MTRRRRSPTLAKTLPIGSNPHLFGVASLGGLLVGVGEGGPYDPFNPMLWTSTEGKTWQLAPSIAAFDGGVVRDSASNGGHLVVVGEPHLPSALTPRGYVWVATPA